MKEEEKLFFKACIKYIGRKPYNVYVKDIISILSGFVPYKRLWYFVQKWSRLGFYNWGVSMGGGWFEVENMPERYRVLLLEAIKEEGG